MFSLTSSLRHSGSIGSVILLVHLTDSQVVNLHTVCDGQHTSYFEPESYDAGTLPSDQYGVVSSGDRPYSTSYRVFIL